MNSKTEQFRRRLEAHDRGEPLPPPRDPYELSHVESCQEEELRDLVYLASPL